jgi:hypothetical protein
MDKMCWPGGPLAPPTSGNCMCCNTSFFAGRLKPLDTSVTGILMGIWRFQPSPTVSVQWLRLNVGRYGEPLISETWKAHMPNKGSSTDNRGGLMLSRPLETVPKKADKPMQRLYLAQRSVETTYYTSSLLSWEAVKTNSPLLPLLLKDVVEMLLSVLQTYAALSLVLLLLKCSLPSTLKCIVIKEN